MRKVPCKAWRALFFSYQLPYRAAYPVLAARGAGSGHIRGRGAPQQATCTNGGCRARMLCGGAAGHGQAAHRPGGTAHRRRFRTILIACTCTSRHPSAPRNARRRRVCSSSTGPHTLWLPANSLARTTRSRAGGRREEDLLGHHGLGVRARPSRFKTHLGSTRRQLSVAARSGACSRELSRQARRLPRARPAPAPRLPRARPAPAPRPAPRPPNARRPLAARSPPTCPTPAQHPLSVCRRPSLLPALS